MDLNKVNKYLFIIISNIFFTNFFLQRFFQNNIENRDNIYQNLISDFQSIGLTIDQISSTFIVSCIIGVLNSIFVYLFLEKNIKTNNLNSLFKGLYTLFFINAGLLLSIFYFLRFFNFSRLLLIFNIFIYPIIFLFLFLISENLKIKNKILKVSLFFIILGIPILTIFTDSNESQSLDAPSIQDDNSVTQETIVFDNVGTCDEWLGSEHSAFKCLEIAESKVIYKFDKRLNNIITYNNKYYFLQGDGIIYDELSKDSVFLDLRDNVVFGEEEDESGLFSLAFHPRENYFIVSYASIENNLVIEKYKLDNENNPILDSKEILVQIPNISQLHYSGNIIWSEYFDDFIVSVGDMGYPTNSIDTSTSKGKLFLLNNSLDNLNIPNVSDSKKAEPVKNLIAYGLRNPWKTFEYKNLLFIPDVGSSTVEEINIVNLDEISQNVTSLPLFGWPIFEGNLSSEIEYTGLLYWEDNIPSSSIDFAINNSISPKIYYQHQGIEIFRAAVIGGGVVDRVNSSYYEHYIFADFLSNELFAYDFINNSLFQLPLPDGMSVMITSILVDNNKEDKIILSTWTGEVIEVSLPQK